MESKKDRPHIIQSSSENINFKRLWKILRLNVRLLLILTLTGICISIILNIFRRGEYRVGAAIGISVGSTSSQVTSIGVDLSAIENGRRINSLMDHFRSPVLAEKVLKKIVSLDAVGVMLDWGILQMAQELWSGAISKSESESHRRVSGTLASEFMSHFTATPDFDKQAISIVGLGPHSALMSYLTNFIAKNLVEFGNLQSQKKLNELKSFLMSEEDRLGKKLTLLESELTEVRSTHRMISLDETERNVLMSVNRQEQQLIDAHIKLNANQQLIEQTEHEMASVKNTLGRSGPSQGNLYLSELQHRLNMLQYQDAVSEASYDRTKRGSEPEKIKVREELKEVVGAFKQALDTRTLASGIGSFTSPLEFFQSLEQSLETLRSDNRRLRSEVSVLGINMESQRSEIPRLAVIIQRIGVIKRNIQVSTDLYLTIKKRLQELEIQEASTSNDVHLVSAAQGGIPVRSSVALQLIFAGALGFFVGFVILLVGEAVRPKAHELSDLSEAGLVPLGQIPYVKKRKRKAPLALLDESVSGSFEAEAFRALRLRLISECDVLSGLGENKIGFSLVVASVDHNSGKTFVATNLAYSLARGMHNTILIDLNLRYPSVAESLRITTVEKSLDLVKSYSELKSTIYKVSECLDAIVCLRPSQRPLDFLESIEFLAFLEDLKLIYEFIIIDASPVLSSLESILVAPRTDGVALIVESSVTIRSELNEAVARLREAKTQRLFGVMNLVRSEFLTSEQVRFYRENSIQASQKRVAL